MDIKKAKEALDSAAATLKQDDEPPAELGQMTVERLCLVRPDTTISIPNIARLEATRSHFAAKTERSELAQVILVLVCAGLLVLIVGQVITSLATLIVAIFCAGTAAFLATLLPRKVLTPARDLHRLRIHTNDGGLYVFFSYSSDVIEKARRIITDKMNGTDEKAVYNINFEQGVIQNMGIENIGSVGAIVSGQGNQVMAATGNSRVNTIESVTNITRIDYSEALPHVSLWKEHFQNLNQNEVAARFDQLERLLKTGTPTQGERYKLRNMLTDLGSMFATSAQAVQLFELIRRIAGL